MQLLLSLSGKNSRHSAIRHSVINCVRCQGKKQILSNDCHINLGCQQWMDQRGQKLKLLGSFFLTFIRSLRGPCVLGFRCHLFTNGRTSLSPDNVAGIGRLLPQRPLLLPSGRKVLAILTVFSLPYLLSANRPALLGCPQCIATELKHCLHCAPAVSA